MSVAVVSRFFALGSFVVLAGVAWSAVDARVLRLGTDVLWAGAGMAAVAMLGSLWFSEVAGFPPCTLCWYQRIAMYPLVVVLGVAAARRDRGVWRTAGPLVVIGAAISAFHYAQQWLPWLAGGACAVDVPCSTAWFRQLGFISIPYLAFVSFAGIGATLLVSRRLEDRA